MQTPVLPLDLLKILFRKPAMEDNLHYSASCGSTENAVCTWQMHRIAQSEAFGLLYLSRHIFSFGGK